MKKKLIFVLLSLLVTFGIVYLSWSLSPNQINESKAFSSQTENLPPHLALECKILNHAGKVLWSSTGKFCYFLNTGHMLQVKNQHLSYFDENMHLIWRIPYEGHHQMRIYDDSIYLLSSQYYEENGKPLRDDRLIIVNFAGEVLKDINLTNFFIEGEKVGLEPALQQEGTFEKTHVNSISRIPKNSYSESIPGFQEGNFIVNELMTHKALIFDPQFENVLFAFRYSENGLHDTQVLESGEVLTYQNRKRKRKSRIALVDPINEKTTVLFQGSEDREFFSSKSGGAQLVGDSNLLLSDCTSRPKAIHYNVREQKIVWEIELQGIARDECYQEIKAYDLSGFLQKNSGL